MGGKKGGKKYWVLNSVIRHPLVLNFLSLFGFLPVTSIDRRTTNEVK